MSYLLLREGEPPFVLTVENAPAYFDIFTALRDVDENSPASLFRLLGARRSASAPCCAGSRTAATCWTRRGGASILRAPPDPGTGIRKRGSGSTGRRRGRGM